MQLSMSQVSDLFDIRSESTIKFIEMHLQKSYCTKKKSTFFSSRGARRLYISSKEGGVVVFAG